MDIGDLLRKGVELGCSDLHLSAGMPPLMRIDGDMTRVKAPDLEHKNVSSMVYDIMNDKQRKDFNSARHRFYFYRIFKREKNL